MATFTLCVLHTYFACFGTNWATQYLSTIQYTATFTLCALHDLGQIQADNKYYWEIQWTAKFMQWLCCLRPVPLVTCPQLNDPSMQQQFIMSHQNRRETACTSRWPVELQTKRRKHQVRIMLYWNWDSSKPSELLMTDTVQTMSTEDALTCYTMVTDEKCMHAWWINIRLCTDSQIQSTLLFLHNCLNWVNLVEFATHPTSYAHLLWYFHSLSSLC